MRVVGYVRVSTEEQATGGVSLGAHRDKIIAYAKLYDLELVEMIEDAGVSGKTLDRPGLTRALQMLKQGAADGLVVAKLDRLTRSVADMAALVSRYFGERAGKSLLSVADQVDTRSSAGRLVLNVLVSVAQWEREAIAERTAEALRHKRAAGQVYGPVPLGSSVSTPIRPFVSTSEPAISELPALGESSEMAGAWFACGLFENGRIMGAHKWPDFRCSLRLGFVSDAAGRLMAVENEGAVVERARQLRATGLSLRAVARQLTSEGCSTKRGGRWHAVTVAKLIERAPIGVAAG
jgi:DNA invertase Pin-like site-specific DNA recombinase